MSSLKKNILLLYLLQAATYLIPLVTVPYLSRVLDVKAFGVMGIAAGVVGVMTLLTDWGFTLTATQAVARNAGDSKVLHHLFWDVFWARVGLGVIAFIGLAGVFLVVPSIQKLGLVMLAASVQVLSSMLSVNWFLQGLEKMGTFAWTFLLGRVFAIPLTFLFVHAPEDVAIATLIPGICGLLSCYISFWVANKHISLFPVRLNSGGMILQLKDGAKVFLSTGAINLYTQSNILILGALTNSAQVGLYYGAERIRRAVQSLIGPASTALFPRINNLMANDRQAAKHMMMRMLILQGSFTLVLSIIMWVVAPWGVPLALGRDYVAAIPVVQWLSPLPFIIGLSNVLGINVMLPHGMKNEFAIIVTSSAILNLIAMTLLCPSLGAKGAAISTVITESFVTATMAYVLYRRKTGKWRKTKIHKG